MTRGDCLEFVREQGPNTSWDCNKTLQSDLKEETWNSRSQKTSPTKKNICIEVKFQFSEFETQQPPHVWVKSIIWLTIFKRNPIKHSLSLLSNVEWKPLNCEFCKWFCCYGWLCCGCAGQAGLVLEKHQGLKAFCIDPWILCPPLGPQSSPLLQQAWAKSQRKNSACRLIDCASVDQ